MAERRCNYRDKVYRGQDFYHRYCETCPQRSKATITPATICCPYLREVPPSSFNVILDLQAGQLAILPRGGY